MWMVIIATLIVAFASGLSLGSTLERTHWESAIKAHLDKLDALLSRHARRVRARRARRMRGHRAGPARLAAVSHLTITRDEAHRKAANAA